MDWKLFKTNKPLMALLIISLAIFPSIFIGTKAMGIVFLVYIVVIVWNLKSNIGSNILSRVSEDAWNKGLEATSEKQYGKAGIFFVVFPMMIVGIIMIGVIIFSMLFLL